ncbi:ABC transporter substrate-binding protein [Streptomyces nogalater]
MGWKKYDPYPVAPTGDIAKAREHLAKAETKVTKLTYAYPVYSPQDDQVAQVLADAFAKIGIELVVKGLQPAAFNARVFRNDAPYDLWLSTNSVDWPTLDPAPRQLREPPRPAVQLHPLRQPAGGRGAGPHREDR